MLYGKQRWANILTFTVGQLFRVQLLVSQIEQSKSACLHDLMSVVLTAKKADGAVQITQTLPIQR